MNATSLLRSMLHTAHGHWARQTTPENIWKTQAKFVSDKITKAKKILWRISGESILGEMVNHQGAAKIYQKLVTEKDYCMCMF